MPPDMPDNLSGGCARRARQAGHRLLSADEVRELDWLRRRRNQILHHDKARVSTRLPLIQASWTGMLAALPAPSPRCWTGWPGVGRYRSPSGLPGPNQWRAVSLIAISISAIETSSPRSASEVTPPASAETPQVTIPSKPVKSGSRLTASPCWLTQPDTRIPSAAILSSRSGRPISRRATHTPGSPSRRTPQWQNRPAYRSSSLPARAQSRAHRRRACPDARPAR